MGTLEVSVARRINLDKSKRICTHRMKDDLSFCYYTLRYCIEEHITLRVNAFVAIYLCIQLQVGVAIGPTSPSARLTERLTFGFDVVRYVSSCNHFISPLASP